MVFAYLEPKEVAAFRWVGRDLAEIGLQYLTPKIHLELNEKSYDRLLAIAEHPIASKRVVELIYDTEGLEFITRESFDPYLEHRYVFPQRHALLEVPKTGSIARDRRALTRELKRFLKTRAQLRDRAWSIYEEYLLSHEKVEQAGFFREKMTEAFKYLPNLKTISASTTSVYEQYNADIRKIEPSYWFFRSPKVPSPIVGATIAVLSAAGSAGLQINHFCCQPFSCQAFTQDIRDMPIVRRSMHHLKTIDIAFAKAQHPHRLTPTQEDLTRALVRSFITSAPDLECLTLSITPVYWRNASFDNCLIVTDITGDFYWSSLKNLSLDFLASTEHDLVHLCERHAHTLRKLCLQSIGLYQGLWSAALHRMRRAFRLGAQLDACEIAGFSLDESENFWLDEKYLGYEEPLGRAVSNYLRATDVGDITLYEYFDIIGLVWWSHWPSC